MIKQGGVADVGAPEIIVSLMSSLDTGSMQCESPEKHTCLGVNIYALL